MTSRKELEVQRDLDSIGNEFEGSWVAQRRPNFEAFLARVAPDLTERLLRLLLEVDVELRTKAGQRFDAREYEEIHPLAPGIVQDCLPQVSREDTRADDEITVGQATTNDRDPTAPPSKVIGRYKLLQQIGEGGMGTVWMAEQKEPIQRTVALKVIKAGMDSRQVIARFEAERQALAIMDHHNIAKVLDAGMTEDQRPYFVMELVKGVPITQYCDENKLSLRERLELFVAVCNAVQHAHQKGIIHRDLKPSNVLITLHDGQPIPKVIDFGLAKALEHQSQLTDKSVFTEIGQIVGTLQYMSPEQAEVNALDVDTRTDIYSLGVILYELLTGGTPLVKQDLQENALLEILEAIRETDPLKPSDRVNESGYPITEISQQRSIDPRRLSQSLRGELDWIVMKALEKDRARRYESARDLGQDVSRYINNDVVEARPPSRIYRARKFIKKHRAGVATVSVIALSLIVATAVSTWFAFEANQSRAEESEAKQLAIQQRDAANRRLDLAIAAVENYYSGVSEDLILKEPQMKGLRERLLQQPLLFFEQLQKGLEDDATPENRYRMATANHTLYQMQIECGRDSDASQSYATAISLLTKLVEEDPSNPDYLRSIVKCEYDQLWRLMQVHPGKKFEDVLSDLNSVADDLLQHTSRWLEVSSENETAKAYRLGALVQSVMRLHQTNDSEVRGQQVDQAVAIANNLQFEKISSPSERRNAISNCGSLAFPILLALSEYEVAQDVLTRAISFLEDKRKETEQTPDQLNALSELIDYRIMIR